MEFPIDMPQEYRWATVAVMALVLVASGMFRHWREQDRKRELMHKLLADRAAAITNKNIKEWHRLNAQIMKLSKTLLIVAGLILATAGCKTVEPRPSPIVVGDGQGVQFVNPGDVVPSLLPDAHTWILIDDVRWDSQGFQPF